MNSLGAEARLAPNVTAKDKQTLVLFLLGLLLISVDFWHFERKTVRDLYSVSLEENPSQWRVLSDPASGEHDNPTEKEIFSSRGRTRVLPLLSEQEATGDAPAQISLFINRPLPINSADKDALEMLPGVGPHLAAAIFDELQRQGRFAGPEDLLKVSGIGPKTLQRLLPLISFE